MPENRRTGRLKKLQVVASDMPGAGSGFVRIDARVKSQVSMFTAKKSELGYIFVILMQTSQNGKVECFHSGSSRTYEYQELQWNKLGVFVSLILQSSSSGSCGS